MAALLVAMSVMAIMLSVALPAWSHMIRREKEEELIFRAEPVRACDQPVSAQVRERVDRRISMSSSRNVFFARNSRIRLSPNEDGEFQLLYLQDRCADLTSDGAGPGRAGRGRAQARALAVQWRAIGREDRRLAFAESQARTPGNRFGC